MKKVIKKILLIALIVFIIFYVYRLSLFLYAYNVIDKKVSANFNKDYSVKMNFGNDHKMTYWISNDYYKMAMAIPEDSEASAEFGEAIDTWVDRKNKIEIRELANKSASIKYFESEAEIANYRIFAQENNNGFTSKYNVQDLIWAWKNIKDYGLLNALSTTFVMPVMMVDSIKTENIGGKEYIVVKSLIMQTKSYVDKSTYLPYAIKGIGSLENDIKYEFSYEPITRESLEFPNLDEYYVIVQ